MITMDNVDDLRARGVCRDPESMWSAMERPEYVECMERSGACGVLRSMREYMESLECRRVCGVLWSMRSAVEYAEWAEHAEDHGVCGVNRKLFMTETSWSAIEHAEHNRGCGVLGSARERSGVPRRAWSMRSTVRP